MGGPGVLFGAGKVVGGFVCWGREADRDVRSCSRLLAHAGRLAWDGGRRQNPAARAGGPHVRHHGRTGGGGGGGWQEGVPSVGSWCDRGDIPSRPGGHDARAERRRARQVDVFRAWGKRPCGREAGWAGQAAGGSMVGGAAELAGDACAERHVAGDLSMRRLAGAGAGWTRDEGDDPRRTGVGRLRTADGRGRLLSVGTRREISLGVGGGEVRCGFVRLLPEGGAGAGGEACCGLGVDGAGPV